MIITSPATHHRAVGARCNRSCVSSLSLSLSLCFFFSHSFPPHLPSFPYPGAVLLVWQSYGIRAKPWTSVLMYSRYGIKFESAVSRQIYESGGVSVDDSRPTGKEESSLCPASACRK